MVWLWDLNRLGPVPMGSEAEHKGLWVLGVRMIRWVPPPPSIIGAILGASNTSIILDIIWLLLRGTAPQNIVSSRPEN